MTVRRHGSTEGRWMIDVQIETTTGEVRRDRKVFRGTKREALAREREMRAELANPTPRKEAAEVPTLEEFSEEYLRHCNTTNRPQYFRKKQAILRAQIVPAFGRLRLDAIGVRTIDAYRSLRAKDVEAKTINGEVGVLLHMLRTAHAWELTEKTPKVKPLKVPVPEFDFLEDDEQARLVEAARRDATPWAAMILTALRTGLRLGELRGLRWRDVDVVAGRVVVRVAADDRGELHPPKSGKPREVPLGDEVSRVLKAHRHLRPHVFDREDGAMLTSHHCRKALDRITRRAGLRPLGWHVLRHTFASTLVMRGATMRAVQDLLGHGSMAMTLRYSHLSPDARRDAVRLLDEPRQHGGNATTEKLETGP